MSISVVISTRNRAESLERTLRSVRTLASEIIVVDNESSDDTQKVAKAYKATVFRKKNSLMLNTNKNFGFSKASGDWILCLDDDEEVPKELAEEITSVTANTDTEVTGYWIARKNRIFGKWIQHGIWWPDRQLRLFKNGSGRYPEKHVHEYLEVRGPTAVLETPYIHYNYDSLSQYLRKMQDVYTESEVQKYIASGYHVVWSDAIRFPASDFLKLYFAQSGYKDGLHGLVLAGLQAFYSFLIFVKLWEREQFREVNPSLGEVRQVMQDVGREGKYWSITATLGETKPPLVRFWLRLLRRIVR